MDHIHAGTVVGKLEGDPATTKGYYDVCREEQNTVSLETGVFFDQDWASQQSYARSLWRNSCRTNASINPLFGEDVVSRVEVEPGHPQGIAAGATANRVAWRLWSMPENA